MAILSLKLSAVFFFFFFIIILNLQSPEERRQYVKPSSTLKQCGIIFSSGVVFFSYEAEISSCFVQLLHVHQGKVSYLGPNYFFNRIGACKGRLQSQQLRMFCPLELCLALASTETSNFHAKFNQDIKSFFTLDKKLASAICPRT